MPAQKMAMTSEQLLSAPRSGVFELRLKQAGLLKDAGNKAWNESNVDLAQKLYERAQYMATFDTTSRSGTAYLGDSMKNKY